MSSIEFAIKEVDLPLEQSRVLLSGQVAFACVIVFNGAETWGLQPLLLEALREYATQVYTD